jgi:HAMP domain-containing protein
MSLLIRINLALGAVFMLAALTAGYACRSILEANAQREVFTEAGLMMDSALAIRNYTANEILPLLSGRMEGDFPPQSVPFYAATQNFLQLRARHPEYMYKEATLNPTNPRDRAADWEGDIVQRFRSDPQSREMVGVRDTPMGKSMYLARPIRNEAGCATCHSTPSAAPRSLIARYGSDNGFGWQANEVVGAQIVSVPFANAEANAGRVLQTYMISLAAIFAAVFLVVNAVLYFMVVRPLRQIVRVADRLSLGDMSAEDFSGRGAKEIASLVRSFNRMRKSLDKALHLLEK